MSNLGAALGWKFNHEPGICTSDGVLTKWPTDALGPEPDNAAQQTIMNEYDARDVKEEDYTRRLASDPYFEALALVCGDQFGMSEAQMKAAIKAKL